MRYYQKNVLTILLLENSGIGKKKFIIKSQSADGK